MSGTTQKTILDDAIAGDEQQWRVIWDLYRPLVAAELRRVVTGIGADDVEDILQNSFTVLFLRLPEFETRGPGSFRAFLREIARRQALAWIKSDNRRRSPVQADASKTIQALTDWSTGSGELAAHLEQEHRQYWLAKLLEECERRCQESDRRQRDFEIFRLVQCNGQDITDAAQQQGVSLATAYRALHEVDRVLAAIRHQWRDLID